MGTANESLSLKAAAGPSLRLFRMFGIGARQRFAARISARAAAAPDLQRCAPEGAGVVAA